MDPQGAGEAARVFDRALGQITELRRAHPALDETRARTAYQLGAEARLRLGYAAGAITHAERELALEVILPGRSVANAGAVRNQALAYPQIGRAHELRGETE